MTRSMYRMIQLALCGLAVMRLGAAPQAHAQSSTDVCVMMTGTTGQVAGLQLDLHWDATCMAPQMRAGTAASCQSNPATGKNVQTSVSGDKSSMRAIFFSISDTSPIPDDSELFCCKFSMASRSGGCCGASTSNLILSGPTGNRVYDPVSVQVSIGNVPCAESGPSGSPDNPVRPPAYGGPAPVIAPQAIEGGAAVPAAGGSGAGSSGSAPAAGGAAPSSGSAAPVSGSAPSGLGGAAPGPAGLAPGLGGAAAGGRAGGGLSEPSVPGAGTGAPAGAVSAEGGAPTAAAPQFTPAAGTPRVTPQRTLAPTPLPTARAQKTGTAAAVGSPTPAASPQTPVPTPKKKGKKRSAQ